MYYETIMKEIRTLSTIKEMTNGVRKLKLEQELKFHQNIITETKEVFQNKSRFKGLTSKQMIVLLKMDRITKETNRRLN